ncbi:integrase [Paraburkholderia elongata]|uniref:Integrase n=1 Tax=Paraburkholderia elongata TaxID=2675747 RepID=A0A972NUH1_9BURK|nr:integrase [Paraburkholderia elongata]NPT60056.1 integrase [Paraburkholderia elongata]
MNAPVLHFTPRGELEPQANLEAFIELCKQSEVLGARGQFDLNVWDIGRLKGQNKIHRAVFSSLEAASEAASEPCMPQPFLDFAKAALVYLHDKRPVVSQAVRLSAFRCLEAALREWNKASRPTAVNVEVLDTAVELARKQVSAPVAYRIAGQLELIAEFMNSKGFISLRRAWVHGMKKPRELGSRISKEALDARQDKLPSAAVLRALAGVFQEAVQPSDVLVSSYMAVMLCAPERINEVLRLMRNCLVEGDGRFDGKLGLRWAGSKLAEDTTKWLPTQMVPVARQAIANLVKVTASAQKIAAWYTDNPNALYLHEGAAHLRERDVLTLAEVALILWGDENAAGSATMWARETSKLEKVQLAGRKIGYRFDDVERAVLAMLPETFPFVPGAPELLCKDAMAITRTNEMHAQRATYLCMFTCVDYTSITNQLGAREGRSSIFERFNYTEDNGSPIELQSHNLRHYLNMLAQLGGLSSAEIAIFSGRKDVRQNRAYDHMSSDEVQAPISQALKAGFTANLVPAATRDLITRSEFKGFGIVAAHTTQYGWCMHNFASEPCQMYRDCINCEEQECVKGDAHKEANLRLLREETEFLLKEAREALNDEEYGADVWVEHQSRTLERVNALLSIVDDPSVQPGSRIRLNLENAALITADSTQPIKFLKAEGQKLLP